jgi:hypothetical protein
MLYLKTARPFSCSKRTVNTVSSISRDPDILSPIVHRTQWQFERLAKKFEALECDLKECQDAAQRKENLQHMKAILNEVDELLTPTPTLNPTRNR